MRMFVNLDIKAWTLADFTMDYFSNDVKHHNKTDIISGIAFVNLKWVFDDDVISFSDNLLSVLYNTIGALYSIKIEKMDEGNLFAKEEENFYSFKFRTRQDSVILTFNNSTRKDVNFKILLGELIRFSEFSFRTIEYCYQDIDKNKNFIEVKDEINQMLHRLNGI